MRLVRVDPHHPDPSLIAEAAALLRAGRLVAFPTETVYGLGANALDPDAVGRIYQAKGRPSYNPLIVHGSSVGALRKLVTAWDERAAKLAEAFWPGPLTLVLPKVAAIPDIVSAGLPSVAVRIPAHPVARALLAKAGVPLAAPSANRSMRLSPTTGMHVAKSLGEGVDLILDAGPTAVGIESTVVDLTSAQPRLLRPGTISLIELEAVIGPLLSDIEGSAGEAPRPSPGMLDKHYAPRARVVLVEAHEMARRIDDEYAAGRRIGALPLVAEIEATPTMMTVIPMPNEPRAYATELFAALHRLDDAQCDVAVVERVPNDPEWAGVRDRLERAAR